MLAGFAYVIDMLISQVMQGIF
ncbi:MAG: hypothetical protein MZV64_21460 [Ignavibacteriales bacterium]|nr:hypothetical protein [Ignavibacteriales bacterium]